MIALVTGANGFVGSAIVRALCQGGWQVRALVRAGSDLTNLGQLPVETIRGDITDSASLDAAVTHCDALFHAAADYRLWTPDPQRLYRTNVEGTRNVLEAAQRARIARIVYTSSVATIGLPPDGSPGTEATPVGLAAMIGHYKRSKFLAEELVRELARGGLPVVIVNPSTPVGPGDVRPTPTGRLVIDAALGRMPAYVDTGLNIVHVDDVAAGHLRALERGRVGERYILGGENLTLKEILAAISRLAGVRPPRVRLPHAALLPVALGAEVIARITGRETRLTLAGVRMARKPMYFSSDKAVRELGYTWRPPAAAFADALAWLRSRGL